MATRATRTVPAVLAAVKGADETDRDLLERFAAGDESAFAALVNRHAGMVHGVCRRVLPTVQDAEDACQATFLVLARKAGSMSWHASVAGWLYGTARRIAAKANRSAQRRTKREQRPIPSDAPSVLDQMTGREAFAALDAELDRLPPIYRGPLVLCYLEGLTRDEAAARLGVPAATLKSHLDRGRKRLADALARRGIGLGAALLAVAATTSPAGASSPRLAESILGAVRGSPSAAATALAREGAVSAWQLKGTLALVTAVAMGFGVAAMPPAAQQSKPTMKAENADKPVAKADAKNDPKKPETTERTVTGKVIDSDGKPRQAELLLFWKYRWMEGGIRSGGKTELLGKTAADGTFTVTVPRYEPEAAFLLARADGFGIAFPTANTPTDVTFKLVKDVPLKARIVDGTGKPIAGATVRLEAVETYANDSIQAFLDSLLKRTYFREHPVGATAWFWHPEDGPFRATTDADGRFALTGIGAERLAGLKVTAPGREDAQLHVVTRAGLDPKPYNAATLSLQPKTGEKLTWDSNPILAAPDFTLSLEAEQPVRGRVTDAKTGKARAGVEVTMSSDNGVIRTFHRATTDATGLYELRGAKKMPTYTVNTREDNASGHLPAQVDVKDTVGHEPVVADIACQRGVLVTGTVRNKATGKPVPDTRLRAHVLSGNTFAKDYPTLGKYAGLRDGSGKPDGTYRVLIIPGPVLLDCGNGEFGIHTAYGPPKADPDYPQFFTTKGPFSPGLNYFGLNGSQGGVDGNWCKVINAKATDTELKLDIELEPVVKKPVKVVDADGKPVKNAHTTGFTRSPWHYAEQVGNTDEIPVFDLMPKEKRLVVAQDRERKLVGAAEIGETDASPVVKLGMGGTAKGRIVNADGKPVAGVTVKLYFDRREVAEIYSGLNENRQAVTAADGTFEFDELLPGYDFRFLLSVGRKQYGPEYKQSPTHRIEKHGETLKTGDMKFEPRKND